LIVSYQEASAACTGPPSGHVGNVKNNAPALIEPASFRGIVVVCEIRKCLRQLIRDKRKNDMTETLCEGPAHGATFYLPADGSVRLRFSNSHATGYVHSSNGALARVEPGTRLSLPRGQHTLSLYDSTLAVRVSIVFQPGFYLDRR
jgi:hypothetical protein